MTSSPSTSLSLSLSLDSTLQLLLQRPTSSSLFLSPRRHLHLPRLLSSPTFPSPADAARPRNLDAFHFHHRLPHGSLEVRRMLQHEIDATATLLGESFSEALLYSARYAPLLAFLVKQYLIERQALAPHAAVLVGIYREGGDGEAQLACTADVSFGELGASRAAPTPSAPPEFPYISNMATKKTLRRRGIGWQLLRACEGLIFKMRNETKVYLHCRVCDTGPFAMYNRAGYKVDKTDNVLVWLSFQRRKHLMSKNIWRSSDEQLAEILISNDAQMESANLEDDDSQ